MLPTPFERLDQMFAFSSWALRFQKYAPIVEPTFVYNSYCIRNIMRFPESLSLSDELWTGWPLAIAICFFFSFL